jgi:succinyl-CoA synthetase beta subunit
MGQRKRRMDGLRNACCWKKEIQVGEHTQHDTGDTGVLDHFIVEPFLPHEQTDECYFCIQSEREGEEILFCSQGGR